MDITAVILEQHHEQRRSFALLDELRGDTEALTAVWNRLVVLLEVHAEAEERFFYPRLLQVGEGAGGETVTSEVEDAISDHNEIRDGIAHAAAHEVGSDEWWAGVEETREANDDHMAEEEREDLPDFRQHASLQDRHDIAVRFLTFEAQHADGIESVDKDPETHVEQGGPAEV